jgi:ABC-type transport system involved in cytochrome bd biosynthesis fused ATPase/permease subunit
MSLRDNLTVYNDATEEELLAVIDKLGLRTVLDRSSGSLDVQISRDLQSMASFVRGEAQRVRWHGCLRALRPAAP